MPKFSIQGCYRKMIVTTQKVHWNKSIWNKLRVAKHIFISWMILLEKLRIVDRLKIIGARDTNECVLCNSCVENHKHLFF